MKKITSWEDEHISLVLKYGPPVEATISFQKLHKATSHVLRFPDDTLIGQEHTDDLMCIYLPIDSIDYVVRLTSNTFCKFLYECDGTYFCIFNHHKIGHPVFMRIHGCYYDRISEWFKV